MGDKQNVTAWVTKYALTSGVKVVEGHVYPDYPSMFVNSTNTNESYHGNDWHTSEEAALARAEEMRMKKIASLKKQMAKLENMKFTGV